MNTLNKLKLTLLATSIMLFPKEGYAMDDEIKQESRPSFCSLLPASSLNPFPTAHVSSLDGPKEMKELFGRYFKPRKEIQERLGYLRATKSQEEVKGVTDAIRTQFVEKFTPDPWLVDRSLSQSFYTEAQVNQAKSSLEEVISFALTLSKQEIEERSKALTHMIVDLMEKIPATGHERHGALPSFVSRKPAEEIMPRFLMRETEDQKYNRALGYEVNRDPATPISLDSRLLELHSNQIDNRTKAIEQNKGFLLPTRDPNDRETIPSIISSLMNLKTEDIVRRGAFMRKLLPSQLGWRTELDPIKVAASHLNNDELALRVDKGTSILSDSPALKPIAKQLSYFSVKFEPVDFESFVSLIKENHERLVPWLEAQSLKSPIFNYSFEEISGHVAAMKGGSGPTSSSGSSIAPVLQHELESESGPSNSSTSPGWDPRTKEFLPIFRK